MAVQASHQAGRWSDPRERTVNAASRLGYGGMKVDQVGVRAISISGNKVGVGNDALPAVVALTCLDLANGFHDTGICAQPRAASGPLTAAATP